MSRRKSLMSRIMNSSRRNLPPVSERVAKRIANLRYVTINHRVALLQLYRIDEDGPTAIAQLPNQNKLLLNFTQDPNQNDKIRSSSEAQNVETNKINLIQTNQHTPSADNSGLTAHNTANRKSLNRNLSLKEILSNPLLLVKSQQPIQLAEVKDENVYICTQRGCDWIFSSKFFWENHIRHFHCAGKPYQCPFENCGKSFTGRSKLELHVRSHTDERPFICDKCGHGFRGNQELKAHKHTHTNEKAYQCPKCDKNFKLLSSMKRHLLFHDGNLPYNCDYKDCNKSFKSRYDLKCHVRVHTGEKPYKCKEPGCGMAFRIPCQFTMHKRAHTGERPFKCRTDGCNMAYASSNTLQAHMLTHTTDRPYCCEYCGKTLKHKLMYKAHLKKHEGARNSDSPNGKFNKKAPTITHCINNEKRGNLFGHSKRDLQTHPHNILSKLGKSTQLNSKEEGTHLLKNDAMKLLCPFDPCGKEYEEAIALEEHLRMEHTTQAYEQEKQAYEHKKERQLTCTFGQCFENFCSSMKLFKHSKAHFGFFKCPFNGCSKSVKTLKTAQAHLKMHEKPYTCSLCDKRFASSTVWLKHRRSHSAITDGFSGERQNTFSNVTNLCPECGVVYTLTSTKHECGKKIEKLMNKVALLQTPIQHQQLTQQPVYDQGHHLMTPNPPPHTQQAECTQLQQLQLPKDQPQQQLNQNYSSTMPRAFVPHSDCPTRTHRSILPSFSTSATQSTSSDQQVANHMLQDAPASSLPSHYCVQQQTVRAVLQDGDYHRSPAQMPLPTYPQQQYNTMQEGGIPVHNLDTQSYRSELSRPTREGNTIAANFVPVSESVIDDQPRYVIVYKNSSQQ